MNGFIIGTAGLFLVGLLLSEKRENRTGVRLFKPALSLLFVTASWEYPVHNSLFVLGVRGGLIAAAVGDVCLIPPSQRAFLSGLFFFLLAHLCYGVAFFSHAGANGWTWLGGAVTAAAGFTVVGWLCSRLKHLTIPVAVYTAAIAGMATGAVTVMGDPDTDAAGRWLVFSGAVLFCVSDLFVARNRFVEKRFVNKLAGLPLYYLGQFLLAGAIPCIA